MNLGMRSVVACALGFVVSCSAFPGAEGWVTKAEPEEPVSDVRVVPKYHGAIASALGTPFWRTLQSPGHGFGTIAIDVVGEEDYLPSDQDGEEIMSDALQSAIALLDSGEAVVGITSQVRGTGSLVPQDGAPSQEEHSLIAEISVSVSSRNSKDPVWTQRHALLIGSVPPSDMLSRYQSVFYFKHRLTELQNLGMASLSTETQTLAVVLDWQSLVLGFWGLPAEVSELVQLEGALTPQGTRNFVGGVVVVPNALAWAMGDASSIPQRTGAFPNAVVARYKVLKGTK